MQKPNKEYKIKIGATVRKHRGLKGLKQKELAELVDYSESTISTIENDSHNPTLHQMEDLANALGINFIQLFSEPKIINNSFTESPHSIGNVENQQNHIQKDIIQTMLDRLDKKDEQFYSFMKEVITILKPNNKKT